LDALIGAKLCGTSVTLASGGSGGVFSPSLFIGAVKGYATGHAVGILAPFPTASPGAYALVGMGALLGGTTHAPITSILMLFELTGDYAIILPVMLATTVSTFTARAALGDSIYSLKLRRKGLRLLGGWEETVLTTLGVREVMRPAPPTVAARTPLPDVMARFLAAPITELYVVDAAVERPVRPAALPAGHRIHTVRVPPAWVRRTLRELDLRQRTGVTVISIQDGGDPYTAVTPDPARPLAAGDVLVVLGSSQATAALERLVEETRAT
jgi:hypothetical protein